LRSRFFEYDGFTTVLTAKTKLIPGKMYHFKMAIADVGDRIYDSAVLLKAKSFSSTGTRISTADSIVKKEINGQMRYFSNSYTLGNDLSFSLQMRFNSNEAEILESSFSELNRLVSILEDFQDLKVKIIGHTDNVGTEEENLALSTLRAIAIKIYLVRQGIAKDRITFFGQGEKMPLADNKTQEGRFKNRRVEFRFYY
jgi:outer membrane protein OmpA-like peptidoglycan-associated protein